MDWRWPSLLSRNRRIEKATVAEADVRMLLRDAGRGYRDPFVVPEEV
jgi:hypothetical protein